MSIKRKYISVDAQSKESLQEVRLTNQNNVLHGKEIRLLNPESQQMEDVRNIFFSKEDSQQIAESIKKDVKEELKDDYLTVESAESRFISTSQANAFALKSELDELVSKAELQPYLTIESANSNFISKEDAEDFALKSELEGLASEDHVQGAVQAAMQEIENTYLKKEDAQQLATKEELQSTEQSIESSVQQNYLSIEDASTTYLSQTAAASLASKSEVASAKQEVLGQVDGTYARKEEVQKVVLSGIEDIDLESEYTLTDVAAKINEILAAFRSTSGGNEPAVNPDPGEGSDNIGAKTRITYIPESEMEPVELSITGTVSSSQIEYKTSIKTIEVGRGVTSIGENAFDNCKFLTEVTLPEGLTTIQNSAFSGCIRLETINIPSTTRVIGDNAFQDCSSLTNITLPKGLITIGDSAFFKSGLTEIVVPNTVSDFQGMVFWHCENLTNITIGNSVSQIDSFNGCTALTSITLGDNICEIGDNAFQTCTNLKRLTLTKYTMDEVKSQAYAEHHAWGIPIGCLVICIDGQFISEEEKLTKITYTEESELEPVELSITGQVSSVNIPNIDYIKTIEFGSTVTYIVHDTFSGKSNLQMVTIPNNVTIDSYAFSRCANLTDILIGNYVSLNEFPFASSGIQRVTFPGKTMSEARSTVTGVGNQWRLATGTEVICSDGTFTIQ